MRAPGGPVPLDTLLEAVRAAIEQTSLRRVADAVDLAPSALSKLLEGSPPRKSTERKLREWFLRQGSRSGDTGDATVRAALDVLLKGIPEGKHLERTLDAVLKAIETAHVNHGGQPPGWIARLREEAAGT